MLQSQGEGPNFDPLTFSPTRVNIQAQTRFCQSCGGRSRWDNFLHAPPPFSLESKLLNKTSCSSIGAHLMGHTAPQQKVYPSGPNPAKGRKGSCLDTLIDSNFCERLGHENTSKHLSNHPPKVGKRDRPMLLLSGTF